ncbi:HlyD family secretion protein [Flavobacterium oreochromis]|uniref:HlyD family secretion protein n=1 Tax=Flavobacterium oreochromis TaxID=2906078 RepID=UPI00385AC2EE
MPEHKDIELRSEEVQDILTKVPNWMIRWGSTVVFIILLAVFFCSWLIKYPDVVTAPITITTAIPPQKLIAKTSGKIEAILVKDKQNVTSNMPLAIIENSANYKDVFQLLDELNKRKTNLINFPFSQFKNAQLGDIESSFAVFQKEYQTNQLNTQLQPYQVEATAQGLEKNQLQERLSILKSQKQINLNELEIQKTDVERYEKLHKKGIISDQELEKQKLLFLQSQKNYKNLLNSISQLNSSINDANKKSKANTINEYKENVNLERNLLQSYYQLQKAIIDWEFNYVLKSAINGQLTFLQVWTKNQIINSSDTIFSIVPSVSNGYIGKVKAPAINSGKIKVGQNVNIKLANFPDREFGMLVGKIKNIALTPDKEGNLLIDIALPGKLETSYHKTIPFQQEMIGTAEIITDDLRLIERLLYQFREVFKR